MSDEVEGGSASRFDADWLQRRGVADRAARDAGDLARGVSEWVRRRGGGPLQVVDLGTGAGANVRYLAPWLGAGQRWTGIDHDQVLLDAAQTRLQAWAAGAVGRPELMEPEQRGSLPKHEHQSMPIQFQGESAFAATRSYDGEVRVRKASLTHALEELVPDGTALVTASALLDLVSEDWLASLVLRIVRVGAAALFAQTYDGRASWLPADPADAWVHERFDADQRTDKGLGVALGPDAPSTARSLFESLGFEVRAVRADWRLGPQAVELQQAMVDGWADAVMPAADTQAEQVQLARWRSARHAAIGAGEAELRVGHVDLFAVAPSPRISRV